MHHLTDTCTLYFYYFIPLKTELGLSEPAFNIRNQHIQCLIYCIIDLIQKNKKTCLTIQFLKNKRLPCHLIVLHFQSNFFAVE